jgi:hypothetical protein
MPWVTTDDHGFRSFWHRCGTNADFAADPAPGSAPCLAVLPTTDPGADDP